MRARNYGTALANGYVGGDVIVGFPDFNTVAGDDNVLYADADLELGLDRVAGADSDDLDALKLWENGITDYQVSLVPFDWLDGSTDMLLFSVRRGSALIGHLDSIFGEPIEEGDMLTTPCAGGTVITEVGMTCYGNENGDGTLESRSDARPNQASEAYRKFWAGRTAGSITRPGTGPCVSSRGLR